MLDDLFAGSQRKFKIKELIGDSDNSQVFKDALTVQK